MCVASSAKQNHNILYFFRREMKKKEEENHRWEIKLLHPLSYFSWTSYILCSFAVKIEIFTTLTNLGNVFSFTFKLYKQNIKLFYFYVKKYFFCIFIKKHIIRIKMFNFLKIKILFYYFFLYEMNNYDKHHLNLQDSYLF